jgi:hypothetical protein
MNLTIKATSSDYDSHNNSFERFTVTGSGNTPETVEKPNCVHKHPGRDSGNQVLVIHHNAAHWMESDFVFPSLVEKLERTLPDCLCTQSFFQWDDRTPEEVDLPRFRAEAWFYIEGWTEKRIKTVLAAINKMLYHWGVGVGALVEDDEGGIVRKVNRAIARTAIYAHSVLLCAVSSVGDYIRRWWGHEFSDRSLWGYMADLQADGFLSYASEHGTGKKSRQWLLNVPDLLLLAEACEKRLLWLKRMEETDDDPYGFEWDSMPMHHGATMKLLFDAIFPGWGWNRTGDGSQNEPKTYAETDECQEVEPDQQWAVLTQLRRAVQATGWSEAIAKECDRIAARWGPSWGIEAVYERIVMRLETAKFKSTSTIRT